MHGQHSLFEETWSGLSEDILSNDPLNDSKLYGSSLTDLHLGNMMI